MKFVINTRRDIRDLKAATAQAHTLFERINAKLDEQTEALTAIKAEVKPNGGSSMRDAVNRIDERTHMLERIVFSRPQGS